MGETAGIRTFVCADPPPDIVGGIAGFMKGLAHLRSFRWVRPEQVHVTLKFLGDSSAESIQSLDTNLSRIGGIGPFDINITGAGAFPDISRPRVVWLGVGSGADRLEKLASRVDRAAKSSGYEAEKRRFQPHLTIGRAKGEGSAPAGLEEALAGAPEFSWRCEGFTLMKSVLTPQGPIYTPIREYRLL